VVLDLYCVENCFLAKAAMAFGPFDWLLTFAKAKAG
jgi:hypothetical protein